METTTPKTAKILITNNKKHKMKTTKFKTIKKLNVEWPIQCFDANYVYSEQGVGNMVHEGEGPMGNRSFDNMTIKITDENIKLTHDKDPDFMEGEYRNAYLLSNAFTLPENPDEYLVLKTSFKTINLLGTTGAWFHLDELFTDKGVITSGLGGFKGGAAGVQVTGALSSKGLKGWSLSIMDGWEVLSDGLFSHKNLKDDSIIEVYVNREKTKLFVNGELVGEGKCAFKWEIAPKIIIQLWVDNFSWHHSPVGKQVLKYEDTQGLQEITYNTVEVYLVKEE